MRTYVRSGRPQPAVLSLRHQHCRVSVNGTQILDVDTWWSSDWNLQTSLRKGVNEIEVEFSGGNRAQGIAPVHLFDPVGTALRELTVPDSAEALRQAAGEYARVHRAGGDTVRLSAVPNQLAFSPRELRLKAGRKVTLVFENPDLQIHNVVISRPGTLETVGLLADRLALDPNAGGQPYVPDHEAVLWSTPLVNGGEQVALEFTAPSTPGRYPILCTFPGHWRVMQATLVVE